MSSIYECFDVFLTRIAAISSILLNKDFDFDRLFDILLKKEQLELLLIVLESTDKIEIFFQVPLL